MQDTIDNNYLLPIKERKDACAKQTLLIISELFVWLLLFIIYNYTSGEYFNDIEMPPIPLWSYKCRPWLGVHDL
mgnify:CR=1 FL=1